MPARWKYHKLSLTVISAAFLATLMLPKTACGQGLELNGGFAYNNGNFGTYGFNVGTAWWFTKNVTLAANYDSSWDTTSLTTFQFSPIGALAVKSHLQNFLFGPRIFFSTNWTDEHKLHPFGEVQIGGSHLYQKVSHVNMPTVSASDTEFSWLLGAGVDYLLTSHWSARANLDLLRTHFANEGQSHFHLVLGIAYTFGSRKK
jgi:opacity protein-like surface antigen